jgi:hypothetical protein
MIDWGTCRLKLGGVRFRQMRFCVTLHLNHAKLDVRHRKQWIVLECTPRKRDATGDGGLTLARKIAAMALAVWK